MSAPKWACEYCTYENWPSSLKCTMCRGAKPLLGEDIYRLRGNSPPPQLIEASCGGIASGPSEPGKWECRRCTFLNQARRSECCECGSPKPAVLSNLHEQMQTLRIEEPSTATTTASGSPGPNDLRSPAKWVCPVCTYENWPNAAKCTMCFSPWGGNNNAARGPPMSPERELSPKGGSSRNEAGKRVRRSEAAAEATNNARQQIREADWMWLNACLGVVEGDPRPVETYLSSGGDPARQLTNTEVALLNRLSAFDAGHTLVHLAIRFHREDLLATLLSQIEGSGSGMKMVPSYVAPDLAADIRRHVASTVRQRKGAFPCHFLAELTTFALPAEVEDLPPGVQEQLLDQLLDRDAQHQLESDPAVVNWSVEVTVHLGSRLYALWNRSAGDCLLDSVMQATWGVFDRDNTLRAALADSLHHGAHQFYPRWKEYEASQARLLDFALEDGQWEEDWTVLLSLASQPGASLEQMHVFALAHVLRRPIIVYGVKYVKSFRGETIGYARFEGVYLPLLWEPSFCIRSPLALGYTRGHFSALVPMEPYSRVGGAPGPNISQEELQVTFLPLMDRDRKPLPVHFVTQAEAGSEEHLLRQWLDVGVTEGGLLVAQQRLHKRPLLVAQMTEEWLNHYRRLAQMTHAPFTRPIPIQDYSSDADDSGGE